MLKRKLTPPPPSPPYVVEIRDGQQWRVEQTLPSARSARGKVRELTAVGHRARSRQDPRSTVTAVQLDALYALREQLPSRWRMAIRQLWTGRKKMIASAVSHDQIEVLRRMSHTHGPNWLGKFWFVF